ncbi:MAG: FliI/YscN family ATPase [Verrucomicrobiota bacterium]|nr:FliI/YscN family ATPase [Verrucomicrobiota bacterium]
MIANESSTGSRTGQGVRQVRTRLSNSRLVENRGRVTQMIGLVIESQGPMASVGEICRIESRISGQQLMAEVVGFRDRNLLLMPLGEVQGICPGSEVVATGHSLRVPVGEELLGRVIDGMGQPLDDLGDIPKLPLAELDLNTPHPLKRGRIDQPFETGIKAIDTFVPLGRGQRLGIFAGSGVGKSTLMGMMASKSEADVNVIALIGERGREVREFLERDLDEEGRKKSVVVVATSNQPALARVKGTFLAMTIAEYFRSQGKNVLLMMDSITRFAMAQREIGLAIGEPPSSRGYTPSVFSLLPQLLERAGNNEHGSITGLFNVLVEGDDMNDPVADAARSILDGHLVLSRELASQNQYPAIDVLESVSRLAHDLLTPEQRTYMGRARENMAVHRKSQDLISIGAYQPGSNPQIDEAIGLHEPLRHFLRQETTEAQGREDSWQQLTQTLEQAQPPAPALQDPQQQQMGMPQPQSTMPAEGFALPDQPQPPPPAPMTGMPPMTG